MRKCNRGVKLPGNTTQTSLFDVVREWSKKRLKRHCTTLYTLSSSAVQCKIRVCGLNGSFQIFLVHLQVTSRVCKDLQESLHMQARTINRQTIRLKGKVSMMGSMSPKVEKRRLGASISWRHLKERIVIGKIVHQLDAKVGNAVYKGQSLVTTVICARQDSTQFDFVVDVHAVCANNSVLIISHS